MKKTFLFITMLLTAFAFSSCTSDSDFNEDPMKEVEQAKQAIRSKLFEVTGLDETPVKMIDTLKTYHWEAPFNPVKVMPEGKTPAGVHPNYYYIANGEPFKVVMLYSNGAYRHECGIYTLDNEGNIDQEIIFWDEANETAKTWKNPGGGKNESNVISRLSDEAGAYMITLPKNTKFGFFQVSKYSDKKKGYVYAKELNILGLPYSNENHPFKFYSQVEFNWNKVYQTVTFNIEDVFPEVTDKEWTVVGFEDISRTGLKVDYDCDNDFNDCVFAVNPKLNIKPLPVDPEDTTIIDPVDPDTITPVPPVVYPNQGSVETNFSYTEKKDGDVLVRLSIHVRDTTDVTVTIPIIDQALKDDFAIIAKHDKEYAYSESLDINGNTVELIYGLSEEGYLTITTKGVNAEVLDYCRKTYADGLTFESNLALPAGTKINGTPTITFTKEPYVYITSCVNNNDEATDKEVEWINGGDLILTNPNFESNGLTYTHKFYSRYTLEELKELQKNATVKIQELVEFE